MQFSFEFGFFLLRHREEDKEDYLLGCQTCFRTGCNVGQSGIISANEARRDAGS